MECSRRTSSRTWRGSAACRWSKRRRRRATSRCSANSVGWPCTIESSSISHSHSLFIRSFLDKENILGLASLILWEHALHLSSLCVEKRRLSLSFVSPHCFQKIRLIRPWFVEVSSLNKILCGRNFLYPMIFLHKLFSFCMCSFWNKNNRWFYLSADPERAGDSGRFERIVPDWG